MQNGRLTYWLLGLLATIALASGAQAFKAEAKVSAEAKSTGERMARMEQEAIDLRRSVERIETKLDRVLETLPRQGR